MKKGVMQNKYSTTDVKMIAQNDLYKGFFQLKEYRFKHKLFAGGWSAEVKREVFERGHAVVVLPYDPSTDQLVLIEQIRIPTFGLSATPWQFECVAGMIDENELAEDVARRELLEETGLSCECLQKLNRIFSSPGGTTETYELYWAKIDASQAKGLHGLADEHEDIKVHVISRQDAYQLVDEGIIDNAATIIALQWLQLHWQELS